MRWKCWSKRNEIRVIMFEKKSYIRWNIRWQSLGRANNGPMGCPPPWTPLPLKKTHNLAQHVQRRSASRHRTPNNHERLKDRQQLPLNPEPPSNFFVKKQDEQVEALPVFPHHVNTRSPKVRYRELTLPIKYLYLGFALREFDVRSM